MNQLATAVGIIALIAVCGIGVEWCRRATRRKRFAGRGELSLELINRQFYSNSGLVEGDVVFLWNCIAKTMRVNPKTMRPTDRFDGELAPVPGMAINDEIEELSEQLIEIAERRGIEYQAANIRTVDDVIRLLAQRS